MSDKAAPASPSQVSRNAAWSAADFWTQQMSQLLTFILVGNVLGPEVVGVMNMGILAVLFLATFLENGFGDALIQRAEITPQHFASTFWLMLGVGVAEAALLVAATPLVASFFNEPRLLGVVPFLAIALPFIAISACYGSMLHRQLKFSKLAIRSFIAYGLSFVAAVAMLRMGYGLYSLVAFFVLSRVFDALIILAISGIWPGFQVTRAAIAEIFDYGRHRVAHQVICYMTSQFDRLVIGYFLGPAALGLYSTAERIVLALTNGIAGVVLRVSFPVLSSYQNDRPAFDAKLREFITGSNVVGLPVFIGLAVTSPAVVGTLFSDKWTDAALLMQLLCFAALAQPTNYVMTAATNALGFPKMVLKISMVLLVIRWASCLVAAQFSVETVAFANACAYLLSLPLLFFMANDYYRGKWLWIFSDVPRLLAAVFIMAVPAYGVGWFLAGAPAFEVLGAQVLTGIVTYVAALKLTAPALFDRMLKLVTQRGAAAV